MSLLKLPFIIADLIGMHITATPPNPPLPFSEHIIPDWREIFLKSLALPCCLLRTMYRVACLFEVLVILATHHPSGPLAKHILATLIFNNVAAGQIRITPFYLLGIFLGISGTVLRMKCYETLGSFFTFELCIQKNHALVVTGPYAVIRHPSYVGLIMTMVGSCFCQIQGSWVKECGLVDSSQGRILIALWLSIAGAVVVSLLLRIPSEDKLLRTTFGKEWEAWANRVRYTLIPWIY
ncbi:hypothetical protein L208DRAFT_1358629 [Tricholoma matsutake]|nr:hypothetical protein L208DRAFT_1358629 [Tricholoma matsutake 945]